MRYIDADKIDFSPLKDDFDRARAKVIIMGQPTADVVEVKHGEWIIHQNREYWHYDCPFCDDGFLTESKMTSPPNYCSNCGAKMDGKDINVHSD